MASVKRMSDKEKDEAEKLAEIEGLYNVYIDLGIFHRELCPIH
jgi:hypothetical protein